MKYLIRKIVKYRILNVQISIITLYSDYIIIMNRNII